MSLYSLGDEDDLQSGVPPSGFGQDMCQPTCDIMQPDHPQQTLEMSSSHEVMLVGNPDISLPWRTQEESSDAYTLSSINNDWDTDLGMCLEGDKSLQTKPEIQDTSRENCPRAPGLECNVCGKVFTTASSLSKHILIHSQERSHICIVCKKAFKRQDHLIGHMLTHLKTKPFMCTEQGCNKSYCDSRSLKRHYEVHHGLCTLRETNARDGTQCEDPQKKELPKTNPFLIQNKIVETVSSRPIRPNKDVFKCLVTGIVQQKITSNVTVFQDPKANHMSQTMALNGSKSLEESESLLRNSTSSAYTLINTSSKDSMGPESVICSDPSSQWLNFSSDKAPKNLPVRQSQKIHCEQNQLGSSAGSLGTLDDGIPMEICSGNLNALAQMYMSPTMKASEDTSLWPGCGHELIHETTRTQESTFPNDPDFTKLTIQPCEGSTMQIENPQHLFQPLTSSQLATSHTAVQALPNKSIQQCITETLTVPTPPKRDMKCTDSVQRDPLLKANTTSSYTQFQELETYSRIICVKESVSGSISLIGSRNKNDREHQELGERLTSDTASDGNQLISGNSKPCLKPGKPHRKLPFNKGKLNFTLSSTVSPSQVALESFSTAQTSQSNERKSRLSIFNRIQGGNIYKLPSVGRDVIPDRLHAASGMKELTDPAALLLSGSVGEKEPLVCDGESKQSQPWQDVQKLNIRSSGQKAGLPPRTLKPSSWVTKDTSAGHLVIPVSVPVSTKDQQTESKVNGTTSHLQSITTKTGKKKKRPSPKSLYIPPPLLETSLSPSGCFQSNLRSPNIYLSEYLHNAAFQYPPYTPPPMLSPIRQGTGLYFNTFCTPSCTKGPILNLPEKESLNGGIWLAKDTMVFTVHPHINIGDRFQAEIPERRDTLLLEGEEEKADLVWRPWLDTKAVSHLLNLACSSAVPRGGNNLEFALHCLHLSQGNVMETLNKLLLKETQKYLPQCLADYHYAGSDYWSLTEKRLFKKAYSKNRKNFSYIQSVLPEKSVYQCVEYYYTWKKIISFDRHQTSATEQGANNGHDGEKLGGSMKGLFYGVRNKTTVQSQKPESKEATHGSQQDPVDSAQPVGQFACKECDRVFDRVKSRNAHMKRHRQQEKMLNLHRNNQQLGLAEQVPTPSDITLML